MFSFSKKLLLQAVMIATASLIAGFYMAHYFQLAPAAAHVPQTTPSDQTLQMCERLIRFGQTAYDRGQFAEAKHFFQKAITVYPAHAAAWKKYNMALLSLISAKVETDPAFLPDPPSDAVHSPLQGPKAIPQTDNQNDGC